ncbi:MAG: hypothetical protein R3232_11350, partial [Clostridia bacterium]|nr:hypothetical protein [Clostridia bacterium]
MNRYKKVLRNLAREKKALLENYDNQSKINMWTDVNDLKAKRPPVIIYQVPWSEFPLMDEISIDKEDKYLWDIEYKLRRDIHELRHFPADMVYFNTIECPPVVYDSGFMLDNKVDIIRSGHINAQHFTPVITEMDDIEKIKEATVDYDREATAKRLDALNDIFGGICEVELTGKRGYWFTPWDYLISRTGVTEAMIDLIERPDFVNAYVSRFVDVMVKYMQR